MDPNAMVDPNTGEPMDPNMDLGDQLQEPDLESQGAVTDADARKVHKRYKCRQRYK